MDVLGFVAVSGLSLYSIAARRRAGASAPPVAARKRPALQNEPGWRVNLTISGDSDVDEAAETAVQVLLASRSKQAAALATRAGGCAACPKPATSTPGGALDNASGGTPGGVHCDARHGQRESGADSSLPVWVDTVEGLKRAVDELVRHGVIGVDVEQHSRRSFQGICCTLQFSTPTGDDLVVDCLSQALPSDAIAEHLAPLFADPRIVKVMHGCHNDLRWLQRDWGIRVVNLFDTSVAARALGRPNLSLSVMLRDFGVPTSTTEKSEFQAADWRVRPLPLEMLRYARDDSHYMPRLRDQLTAELLRDTEDGAATLAEVYRTCDEMCLKRYECAAKPTMDDAQRGWSRLCKHRKLSPRELPPTYAALNAAADSADSKEDRQRDDGVRSFAALMAWRDETARTLDESAKYVASLDVLFDIALAAAHYRPVFSAILRQPDHSNLVGLLTAVTGLEADALSPVVVERAAEVIRCVSSVDLLPTIEAVDGGGGSSGGAGGVSSPAGTTGSRSARKAARYERFKQNFSCSKPVYSNCRLLRPDGSLLTFCDKNKVQWYLVRGIATEEPGSDGRVARLKFEPNEPGEGESGEAERKSQPYYDTAKRNQCVRCGSEQHLLRYSIVPRLYRPHMPERFKSHRSHDVVLLCVKCHNVATRAENALVEEIVEEYEIPLDGGPSIEWMRTRAAAIRSVRGFAIALAGKQRRRMPKRRVEELKQEVADFFSSMPEALGDVDGSDIDAMVNRAKDLEPPDCSSAGRFRHGRSVIIAVAAAGEMEHFIKRWRRHFVASLHPAHMPPQWDVDHAVVRSFGSRSRFYRAGEHTVDATGHRDRISLYRGVEWRAEEEVWAATLWHKRKEILIGTFEAEEDAARAYDIRVRELFGVSAITNFEH